MKEKRCRKRENSNDLDNFEETLLRTFKKKFEICDVCFLKYSFQTPSEYANANGKKDVAQFIDDFFFEVLSKSNTTHISISHPTHLKMM